MCFHVLYRYRRLVLWGNPAVFVRLRCRDFWFARLPVESRPVVARRRGQQQHSLSDIILKYVLLLWGLCSLALPSTPPRRRNHPCVGRVCSFSCVFFCGNQPRQKLRLTYSVPAARLNRSRRLARPAAVYLFSVLPSPRLFWPFSLDNPYFGHSFACTSCSPQPLTNPITITPPPAANRVSSLARARAKDAKELARDRILNPDKYKRVHRYMRGDREINLARVSSVHAGVCSSL